jgi:hypothetical protein
MHRNTKIAALAATTLLTAGPLVSVPLQAAPAEAASPLMCRAHMSDRTPKQYTDVTVFVRSAPNTNIKTVAHYKTTDTTKRGKTNRRGHGSTKYYISGATPGYRVWVDVSLTKGSRHRQCRTSFVPHS